MATKTDIKKLKPQQRARYLAYKETPKKIKLQLQKTNKRIRERKEINNKKEEIIDDVKEDERKAYNVLIGQLKAAEARDRIRLMRLRYEAMRSHEIKHLISCQPSSLKAIRFEALVPAKTDPPSSNDTLDKIDRERVEKIVADNKGLTTLRKI